MLCCRVGLDTSGIFPQFYLFFIIETVLVSTYPTFSGKKSRINLWLWFFVFEKKKSQKLSPFAEPLHVCA